MSRFSDVIEEATGGSSVFADKGVLNPLNEPDEIIGREEQESTIAQLLRTARWCSGGRTAEVVIRGGPAGGGEVGEEVAVRWADLGVIPGEPRDGARSRVAFHHEALARWAYEYEYDMKMYG